MNAKYILTLNDKWNCTDSNVIADNVEEIMRAEGYDTLNSRLDKLMDITNSTKHAAYAWFNRGRKNVKIPFLKLCAIAEAFNVDIEELLKGEKNMFEKKFAVTKTVGNNEVILKYFDENAKEEAKAYAAEVAKTNTEGVITCVLARFDADGHMKDGECEVFEVYE